MNILKEMRVTIIGALLAVAIVMMASLTDIDVVKLDLRLLDGIEKHEVDDVVSGFMLILVGLIIDRFLSARRKHHEAEVEAQKLKTLKATMRTVQDIVNNFLNNLMLFEMEATVVMPDGSLDPLQELIQQTSQKLTAFENHIGDVRVCNVADLLGSHHNTENETQTKSTGAKRDCRLRSPHLVHSPSVA